MIKKIFFTIFCLSYLLTAVEIKQIKKVEISQSKILLQVVYSFCVTEYNDIIVVDGKACDIKMYNSEGEFIKLLWEKGPGPGEFITPTFCDYNNSYFTVMDFQKRKVFVYLQKEKMKFKLINNFFCLGNGFDLKIRNNQVLISGYKKRNKEQIYSLFIQNILTNKVQCLIPIENKFGFNSFSKFRIENKNNRKMPIIGFFGFCDWWLNNTYFVWEGNLRIIKTNIKTKKTNIFGEKTIFYKQPFVSKIMIRGQKERNIKLLSKGKRKMSYIHGLFANKDFVGLLYGNYSRDLSGWKIFLQLYTPEGKFLKEKILPGVLVSSNYKPAPTYFFVKNKNLLYYMYHKIDKDLNDIYTIATYKIIK